MQEVLDIVGDIYEAAHQPGHWDHVLKKITTQLNAKSAGLFLADYQTNTYHILASIGLPQLGKMSYRFGLGKYDHAYAVMLEQEVGQCQQIVDKDNIKTTNPLYYRLLLKPNNVGYVSGMNIFKDDNLHVGLGIHRSMQSNQFADNELTFLTNLYPHFRRSLTIYRKLQTLERAYDNIRSAMSELIMGVLIIDQTRKVHYMNPAAASIIQFHPAIGLENEKFLGNGSEQSAKLDAILDQCFAMDPHQIDSSKLSLTLDHENADTPLNLLIGTLKEMQEARGATNEKCVVLYLTNPETSVTISSDRLSDFHGLSSAEVRLTIALVNGLSLQEYAEKQKLSVRTARSQLKSIFDKTGVNRQQDLIGLVLQNPIAQVTG